MIKKIHVTGNAGSGKTSFAKALSKKLQIESHGLDQIVWKPGWVKTSSEEKFAKIQALIEKDAWVIEGVSSQVFRAADTIIFLDLPIWKCIFSIIQRSFINGPGTRKELPENCPEITGIFKAIKIAFIYQKETRPLLLNLASEFNLEKKIYFIKSRKEAERFLMSNAFAEMTCAALLELLTIFGEAKITVWLDGGWGVDALLGVQTRSHRDVDIILCVSDAQKLQDVLRQRGFTIRGGSLPDAFILEDQTGLKIDVHTVFFNDQGNGVHRMDNGQDWIFPAESFTGRGAIAGVPVFCLSLTAQILCHNQGYIPTEMDFQDMEQLQNRFGIKLPERLQRIL